MTKKTFKIKGMHCSSCAVALEWELEDLGVKAKCSYAKAQVEVEYDEVKITSDLIVASVNRAGYSVDN